MKANQSILLIQHASLLLLCIAFHLALMPTNGTYKDKHKANSVLLTKGHGGYSEIQETQFLDIVQSTERVVSSILFGQAGRSRSILSACVSYINLSHQVCHFYHKGFQRCDILDGHFNRLSKVHVGSRFIRSKLLGRDISHHQFTHAFMLPPLAPLRLEAEKAPFFVTKLKIRTLPTAVIFANAQVTHQIVGFGDMGGSCKLILDLRV